MFLLVCSRVYMFLFVCSRVYMFLFVCPLPPSVHPNILWVRVFSGTSILWYEYPLGTSILWEVIKSVIHFGSIFVTSDAECR